MKSINICFSPALYPYYSQNDDKTLVVVVDVFRASTTICAAFAAGAVAVCPVKSLNEAVQAKARGSLVAAERNADKCDFADFGNSPFDYTPEKLYGKTLFFTSTNGTSAIETVNNSNSAEIIIGAFVNLQAVADFCIERGKNILILCAGWKNRFSIEDTLFGGALIEILIASGYFTANSDSAYVSQILWKQAKDNIFNFLKDTEHFSRLKNRVLDNDIHFCLQKNTINLLPIFNKSKNLIELCSVG
ncbi:MAG: 2-phosphosulfolactate phosphatase [Paludibacter sp.]|nr:2-phosphosulfolactate phosphatase [Paludibacter sp.]